MAFLADKLTLPRVPEFLRAKSGFRTDKRSYQEILSAEDADKISELFAREIAYFGYTF